MKFSKIVVLSIFACALAVGATSTLAAPPPPPPGVQLMPGMVWCPRCGGHGRVPSGFLGWHDKRCPECKGRGMLVVRPMPPPPPPPPPPAAAHHHHHHAQPAPQPAPHRHGAQPASHHHAQPAPQPVSRGPVYR